MKDIDDYIKLIDSLPEGIKQNIEEQYEAFVLLHTPAN
jgi:hypothetical protein